MAKSDNTMLWVLLLGAGGFIAYEWYTNQQAAAAAASASTATTVNTTPTGAVVTSTPTQTPAPTSSIPSNPVATPTPVATPPLLPAPASTPVVVSGGSGALSPGSVVSSPFGPVVVPQPGGYATSAPIQQPVLAPTPLSNLTSTIPLQQLPGAITNAVVASAPPSFTDAQIAALRTQVANAVSSVGTDVANPLSVQTAVNNALLGSGIRAVQP